MDLYEFLRPAAESVQPVAAVIQREQLRDGQMFAEKLPGLLVVFGLGLGLRCSITIELENFFSRS